YHFPGCAFCGRVEYALRDLELDLTRLDINLDGSARTRLQQATGATTVPVLRVDEDGNELGPGEIGTVYMRMEGQDFEYKDDPEKTAANRLKGFFTVGDIGELDGDGFLFLRDRKNDMIISGGVNIYPAEIEGCLLQHPSVLDAAVFGIPNEDWGEEIKAVIQPTEGVAPDDALV
ncbi:MAG: glutaredoxin domain-containing protein, partial [Actinomycetota bacterium]